jgi:hypothetical protein
MVMKSSPVKTLAVLIAAAGATLGLTPAQALPGLDRGIVPPSTVQKVGCGPWGCGPGWGGGGGYGYGNGYGYANGYGYGYGYRPHPRPWGYSGYGYGYGGGRPWGWGHRHSWGGPGW